MDESEVEYEEDENGFSVSRRVIPLDFAVIGLGLVRDLFGAFETAFSVSQVIVARHTNYLTDRRSFQRDAAIEIETLTSGDDNG